MELEAVDLRFVKDFAARNAHALLGQLPKVGEEFPFTVDDRPSRFRVLVVGEPKEGKATMVHAEYLGDSV